MTDDGTIAAFDFVIARDAGSEDFDTRLRLAEALVGKGDSLVGMRRYDEAMLSYDRVLEQFGESTEPAVRERLVPAWAGKGAALLSLGRLDEANAAFDALDDEAPDRDLAQTQVLIARNFYKRVLAAYSEGLHEQAIRAADALLTRFADPPRSCVGLVVNGLLLKALAVSRSGGAQEAISLLGELVDNYGDVDLLAVQKAVAKALSNRGRLLTECDERERALEVYDEMLARYGDAAESGLRETVLSVLQNKLSVLRDVRRYEEGLVVAEDLIERIGSLPPSGRPSALLGALEGKAILLGDLDRVQEAISANNDLIERFGGEPELSKRVAWALFRKASALKRVGQIEQSIATWSELVDRYGDANDAELDELVAGALAEQAELMAVNGRSYDDAIALGDVMITRAGDGTDSAGRALLARGLGAKGAALVGEDRYEEAIDIFDTLIARFEDAQELHLRGQVALALNNKVVALSRLGRSEQAAIVRHDLVSRFAQEALKVFDEHARHCEQADGTHAREQLASMLYSKAWVLSGLGRRDEAMTVLVELINRFDEDDNPAVRESVTVARELGDELAREVD